MGGIGCCSLKTDTLGCGKLQEGSLQSQELEKALSYCPTQGVQPWEQTARAFQSIAIATVGHQGEAVSEETHNSEMAKRSHYSPEELNPWMMLKNSQEHDVCFM